VQYRAAIVSATMTSVAINEEMVGQARWDGLDDEERATLLVAALRFRKVSQTDLHKRLDVSMTTVNRWCKGKAPISWARWVSICSILKIPTGWAPPH
jgi:DNA-binding XRE family transcriptional regulator